MLHNKHLEILSLFLGDYEITHHGRGIIGKVRQSPKTISNTLNEMEKEGILRSKTRGTSKNYSLNKDSLFIKEYLIIAEIMRKIDFLGIHKKIAHIFGRDERIVGIFGSYADGSYNKGSDLDIFIIGNVKRGTDHEKEASKFDIDASVKLFSKKEFFSMLRKRDNLAKEIIRNHVIIKNPESFINEVWRNYYGYD